MDNRYRFLTTAIIWVMVSLVLLGIIFAIATAEGAIPTWVGVGVLLFAFVSMIIAGISTHTIWGGGYAEQKPEQAANQPGTKNKRAGDVPLARLVDELSQDEVVELETLLLARDDWSDRENQTG